VEAVAWISERKEFLAATGGLISMLAWMRWETHERKQTLWWGAALLAYTAGLLAKPSIIALPLAFLLMSPANRRPWFWLVPFLAPAILVAWKTLQAQASGGHAALLAESAWSDRILQLPQRLGEHLSSPLRVIPTGLFTQEIAFATGHLLLGLVAILLILWYVLRRKTWQLSPSLAWFVAMFLPVSGLIPLSLYPSADRYTYLTQMGVLWMFLLVLQEKAVKSYDKYLAILIVLGLAYTGRIYATHWQQDLSLWNWQRTRSPQSPLPLIHLAKAVRSSDELKHEALRYYDAAIQLEPRSYLAHYGKGNLLLEQGQREASKKSFLNAIAVRPDAPHAHQKLALIAADDNDAETALQFIEQGLQHFPRDGALLRMAGQLYGFVRGDRAKARNYYQQALAVDPLDTLAQEGLRRLQATP
jgi:protein O-mannosyl-transferase